jgi:hypothetical protein
MRHFGYRGEVEISPDPAKPELLARIGLGTRLLDKSVPAAEQAVFEAISQRHTNRAELAPSKLPAPLLQQLKDIARREHAFLRYVTSDERSTVCQLIERGDLAQGHDKKLRHELAAWICPNDSERLDGIPGRALGLSDLTSCVAPSALRVLDLGQPQSGRDQAVVLAAPALALLETEGDTLRDWLAAGQALEAVLLHARVHGVDASFFNQPIEVAGLWEQLRQQLGLWLYPQLLFRLGYAVAGVDLPPTPRRPVERVLI